jgi:hypothetical protein
LSKIGFSWDSNVVNHKLVNTFGEMLEDGVQIKAVKPDCAVATYLLCHENSCCHAPPGWDFSILALNPALAERCRVYKKPL